ncbi:MAG: transcription antitermination factor NusB [Betaproteobacteria bacterium]|nr:transcription antitermination factor NusB [Betaproteobacteria bacterium]MDE2046977.1 transcription antitermination factor NusB [Betaproteobacteria bacterium]
MLAKSARRKSREMALQGLYEWLLNGSDVGVIVAHTRERQPTIKMDDAHFEALVAGATREQAELDAYLLPCLDRPLAELSPVEHGALLIGAYELKHCPDIPYRVVINECVELAKTFGGTDGYKYVNGVLDKLAANLRGPEVAARHA